VPEDPTPVSEDPTPVSEDPAPVPDAGGDATFDGTKFKGNNSDEIIIGNALDNYIDGNGGDDVLRSDGGADQLWGGAGNDLFLYIRLSDSRERNGIDTITDFTQGEDKIDLHRLNADRNLDGNQAFVLTDGTPGAGELSVHYDASTGMTVINGNVDNDRTSELTIYLAGEHNLTADDFIL
jgi:Ca2+-binding RTX toxin-like protein